MSTIENFGADVEGAGKARVIYHLDKFNGVPATLARSRLNNQNEIQQVNIKKPAPTSLTADTRSPRGQDRIAQLTARFKFCRSAWEFAPPDDKPLWEKRMELAKVEMKIARTEERHDLPSSSPQLKKHLSIELRNLRAEFAELVGQVK